MTSMHKPEQAKTYTSTSTIAKAKPMLAGVLGAIIGCGASLHIYYTLLGGADQNQRLAQVESTVEHNRKVGEQTLALLTEMHNEAAQSAAQAGDALSKKPTQRELSEALDGLFEKLPEGDEPEAIPAYAPADKQPASEPAVVQEKTPDQAGVISVSGKETAAASNQAAKK